MAARRLAHAIGMAFVPALFLVALMNTSLLRAQTSGSSEQSFEVASIKRSRTNRPNNLTLLLHMGSLTATNITARQLIAWAYNYKHAGTFLNDAQLLGGPKWAAAEEFDIDAKVDDSLVEGEEKKLPYDQWNDVVRLMMQSLLATRFKLQVSRGTKSLPVYTLVLATGGPKFSGVKGLPALSIETPTGTAPKASSPALRILGPGNLEMYELPMAIFADALGNMPELEDRLVVDKTELEGRYTFNLHWTPQNLSASTGQASGSSSDRWPSLFTALQEQLGLRLESAKESLETITIEHIAEPAPN